MRTWLWYLLVALLPFTIRTTLMSPAVFNEYLSVFLYVSDVALVLFVLFSLRDMPTVVRATPGRVPLLIFLLLAIASIISSWFSVVSWVALARLILLTAAAVSAGRLLRSSRVFIATMALISLFALAQATVAIMQFTAQSAVGLGVLGESPISVFDPGTAKVTVEGARLLRAYGLMPDPNILAGFLLVGLCSVAYLFLRADKGLYVDAFDASKSVSVNFQRYLANWLLYARLTLAAGFFIISMGLLFTFSRSGWASTALALVVILVMALRNSGRSAGRFLALLLIVGGAAYYFFSPLILARSGVSTSEPSFSYRVEYSKMGLEIIADAPLLGVGIGNQVFEAREQGRYEAHGMRRNWEHQPIHNLYLLIGSEIGVLGALSFLAFLAIVKWRLIRRKGSIEAAFALALLAGLLAFGLFDHFLWDLQPGKLMLWLAIAIGLSQAETMKFETRNAGEQIQL